MEGLVARLHNRYRMIGARGRSAALASRLDRLARDRLPEVLDEALGHALGDDPSVYVIRRLDVRFLLDLGPGSTDAGLALGWSRKLAGSVVRAIAAGPDGENLVRFESEADYVAHFLAELLRGHPWGRWYYEPFARWRARPIPEIVRAVLLENRGCIAEVLVCLRNSGRLEPALALLDDATIRALWPESGATEESSPGRDGSSLRPLFASALELADCLGLWPSSPPDRELLFRAYQAEGPSPPDWRDPRGLASVVLDALGFLADRGYLRFNRAEADRGWGHRLHAALARLDWLDTAWLREALAAWPGEARARDRGRSHPAPTPRQEELLADLAKTLADSSLRLDRERPDSPANALRLYAALVSRAPRWTGDASATAMIAHLLRAWALLARCDSRDEALKALTRGDVPAVLRMLPGSERPAAPGPLRVVAGLGAPGLEIVERLARPETRRRVEPRSVEFATPCAGVFLLVRAILDARLPALVRQVEYPPGGPAERHRLWLAALGLRWAGESAIRDARLDPALALLAGLGDRRPTLDELAEPWSRADPGSVARFQSALLRTLVGLRRIGEAAPSLHLVPWGDSRAIIAGDDAGQVWPLGTLIERPGEVPAIPAGWLDLWSNATGTEIGPTDISVDPAGEPTLQTGPIAALRALDRGRLGDPRADLTVALTALALLRVWAAWLRGFSGSGAPYLLTNFLRQPGRVIDGPEEIRVEIEPGPLDVVLEMAGYTAEIESVPWLDRRLSFRLGHH